MSEFLRSSRGRMVDDLLMMKSKGTVATSMVGESPIGTDKTFDTGGGAIKGDMVLNVYALPNLVAGANIAMRLQGGKDASFASLVDLAVVDIGEATAITATDDQGVGRYVVPFSNERDGAVYRYLRHYATVGATCGTGGQYEIYLSNLA